MKNILKSKKIYAFLLTMIMCLSLFFFSACSDEDEEKLMFKVIYRPYASQKSELFGNTYKDKIKDSINKTAEGILTYIVGSFGIGEVELGYEDFITQEYKTIKISPEVDEYYYETLLGINKNNQYYDEIVSNLVQSTNLYYNKVSSSNVLLVLSNYQATENYIENNLATFDEETQSFVSNLSLKIAGTNNYVKYENGKYNLESGKIYIEETSSTENGYRYSFVFVGGYVSGGASYNSEILASRFVTSLLSTNYNNIQQTVGEIVVHNGVEMGVVNADASWRYSLTPQEMNRVYDARDYLDAYKKKYLEIYKVELAKAYLTRSGEELPDSLFSLYSNATRTNLTAQQLKASQEAFIDACCEYIDHLGIIPEDINSLSKFIIEVAMGQDEKYVPDKIKEAITACFTKAQETLGYVPLLEVLSYKGSTLDSVEINGYIQSVVIMAAESTFEFSDLLAFFVLDEEDLKNEESIELYTVTVRHQNKGEINEYPIALTEEDAKGEDLLISVSDVLEGQESLKIDKCEDPIKTGLLSKKTSIVDEPKDYAKMFSYSTSMQNTKGMSWCFNNKESNFIEITFATSKLCVNKHINIEMLMF